MSEMRLLSSLLFVGLVAGMICHPALGQTISTDRPDFGAGTTVLPIRTVQLETGVKRTRIRESINADQYLESLLRFGAAGPVELRLGWSGLNRIGADAGSTSGAGDLSIGAKVALADGRGWAPAVAVLGTLSLPSGEDAFSAGEEVPEARLALGWALTEYYGLTVNVGSFWTTGPSSRLSEGSRERSDFYSATLGRSGEGGHGVFVELFGILPASGDNQHNLGVGYLYLVDDQVQLDVYVGSGLTEATPDAYIGAGVAIRLPN
ncbi:MAG: transporter [Rhodothermales bacterium]|nr:transporter [Rhodothermales bacterium]